MQLNPNPNKQDNKVTFSRKPSSNNLLYTSIKFNNKDIFKFPHQKQLEIVLDLKLNFSVPLDQRIKKSKRVIGLIRRLSISLP